MPLQIAPLSIEPILLAGNWLCVSMSVWNSDNVRAGYQAVRQSKLHNGKIRLGLRPFDYPEENYTWIPNSITDQPDTAIDVRSKEQNGSLQVTIKDNSNTSPVWVGISAGKFVGVNMANSPMQQLKTLFLKLLHANRFLYC